MVMGTQWVSRSLILGRKGIIPCLWVKHITVFQQLGFFLKSEGFCLLNYFLGWRVLWCRCNLLALQALIPTEGGQFHMLKMMDFFKRAFFKGGVKRIETQSLTKSSFMMFMFLMGNQQTLIKKQLLSHDYIHFSGKKTSTPSEKWNLGSSPEAIVSMKSLLKSSKLEVPKFRKIALGVEKQKKMKTKKRLQPIPIQVILLMVQKSE